MLSLRKSLISDAFLILNIKMTGILNRGRASVLSSYSLAWKFNPKRFPTLLLLDAVWFLCQAAGNEK